MISSILILAAGKGKRLNPITDSIPKPLIRVPVNGKSILEKLVIQCKRDFAQIPIYVNVSHLANKVIEHFMNMDTESRPIFLFEDSPLGPAVTVKKISDRLQGMCLVIHGDLVLANEGFKKFAEFVKSSESQIIVCHYREKSRARSEIIESNGFLVDIREPVTIDEAVEGDASSLVLVSSGIMVIDCLELHDFEVESGQALSPFLVNHLKRGSMRTYLWSDWRYSIDSLDTLAEASLALKELT